MSKGLSWRQRGMLKSIADRASKDREQYKRTGERPVAWREIDYGPTAWPNMVARYLRGIHDDARGVEHPGRLEPRTRAMAGDWPTRGSAAAPLAPSNERLSLSAAVTSLRRSLRSSGFETKSNAPSFSARTAASTLPCAVITATGVPGASR